MKSFGIITINNNRPKILELWCASIKRLRTELGMYIPACVVSGIEDKPICDKYHIIHIEQDNNPPTSKWNRAMAYMRSIKVNYVVIMGSDDIASTDTIRKLIAEMEKGYDLIGVNSVYFYGADGQHRGELCKLQTNNRILGVGKTISSTVLDKIDWRPWTKDRNWGMDAFVTQSIKPHVKSFKILRDTFIVDVKSRDNLNKMTMWAKKIKTREDPQEFYAILSKEEFEILKSI